jgi:hypothetical protein
MMQGEWHSLYTLPTIVPSLTQYYNLILPIKSAHPICHLDTLKAALGLSTENSHQ